MHRKNSGFFLKRALSEKRGFARYVALQTVSGQGTVKTAGVIWYLIILLSVNHAVHETGRAQNTADIVVNIFKTQAVVVSEE